MVTVSPDYLMFAQISVFFVFLHIKLYISTREPVLAILCFGTKKHMVTKDLVRHPRGLKVWDLMKDLSHI